MPKVTQPGSGGGCWNPEAALPAKPLLRGGGRPRAVPREGGREIDEDRELTTGTREAGAWRTERGPPPALLRPGKAAGASGQAMRPGPPRRAGLVTTHSSRGRTPDLTPVASHHTA